MPAKTDRKHWLSALTKAYTKQSSGEATNGQLGRSSGILEKSGVVKSRLTFIDCALPAARDLELVTLSELVLLSVKCRY